MARSPILPLVEQFNGLSDEEKKVFLDLVDPQPEPEKPAKQTRKKRGRSPRAESLSSVIRNTSKPTDTQSVSGEDGDGDLTERAALCGVCGNVASFQDHFKPSPNYHAFDPPKTKKAASAQK